MTLFELLNTRDRPPQQRNKIHGVVVGIVRDIKDPQNLGRVKVDFPWLGESSEAVSISSDEDRAHSFWARIANLMAGNGRGSFFIPEVGDEVLVAFEHGVLDRPYILGTLWNADDPPPEQMDADGKNDVRSIRSRSGHVISLNDSDDSPSIRIIDNTGDNSITIDSANNAMAIKVKGDFTVEVEGNISIKTQGKLEIEAAQDASVKSDANLKAEAGANCEIEASGPAKLKSSAKLEIDGTGQAELKAASVSINGSAMTEVKGGLVKIN